MSQVYVFRLSMCLSVPTCVYSYVHNRILASNRSHIVKLPPNRVQEQFTLVWPTRFRIFKGLLTAWCYSSWGSCTHPTSSCWSAALHSKRPVFKPHANITAALLPSSKSDSICPSPTEILLPAFQPSLFLFQWFPHWKLAFNFKEWTGECLLYKTAGRVENPSDLSLE